MGIPVGPYRTLLQPQWTPKRIRGLQLWLAADRSPLTLEAGMAAQFTEANSEYLSVADPWTSGDIAFWCAAWYYADSKTNQETLAAKYGGAGDREWEMFHNGNNALRFQVFDGTNSVGNATETTVGAPALTTWYFVIGWHDPTANRVYISVNGNTADSANTTGTPPDTTIAFTIGSEAAGAQPIDGRMQCVAFGKGLPTAAMITALYNGGTPLSAEAARSIAGPGTAFGGISYWELNEPSGTRVDSWGSNDLTDNNTVTTNPGTCLNAASQVNDLSGNGNNATQSTQANKPVLRSMVNGINGREVFRLDAVNDQLATATFPAALSQPFTIAVVTKQSAVAAAQTFCDGVANKVVVGTDATPNYVLNASAGADSVGGTPDTNAHVLMAVFDTTDTLYVDGASVISADAGANTLDGLRLGATLGGANFLNGTLASAILYNRALTPTERWRLTRYLGRKYSIAVV